MQKSVFVGAAVLTALVLAVGIGIGIMLENSRVEDIKGFISDTEILFSDARLQSQYYQNFLVPGSEFCNSALRANLNFNDVIYQEGQKIDRYELSNRFSNFLVERRRYALLQFQFWLNAEHIRTLCSFNYSTVLYMYMHKSENDQQLSIDQKVQSAVLLDLKEKCGPRVMLSPLPIDLNLTSIQTVADKHGITRTPAIIINDNITLSGVVELSELERHVKC